MATTTRIAVSRLQLDLKNFRTTPQPDEQSALHSFIAINPDWFWALLESLLEDGYLETENIIVLKGGGGELIVKEGNRRIGALKLIFGLLDSRSVNLSDSTAARIASVSADWKEANKEVPCALHEAREEAVVNRIVRLTHGKSEKAGRDPWNAVARARYARDYDDVSSPALDLLEAYIAKGRNITSDQRERWSGVYPLTVLEELLKKVPPRIGLQNSRQLVELYPKVSKRSELEEMLKDIGLGQITFPQLRSNVDFGVKYGIPAPPPQPAPAGASGGQPSTKSGASAQGAPPPPPPPGRPSVGYPKAVALDDPRSVRRTLRQFQPVGRGREKVVSLVLEARALPLDKCPMAFCFLLRSMFEISAKAFCADHASSGLTATKSDGTEKFLVDVLREVTAHLAGGNKKSPMAKELFAAMAELGKENGIFSVTSLNQLIHNRIFSLSTSDVCRFFNHVFPLLRAMNR